MQDLRVGTEWVRTEHDKLQSECVCSEFRHEDLVKKLKCEFFRVNLLHQEKECLVAEDMMDKIDEEWKLLFSIVNVNYDLKLSMQRLVITKDNKRYERYKMHKECHVWCHNCHDGVTIVSRSCCNIMIVHYIWRLNDSSFLC